MKEPKNNPLNGPVELDLFSAEDLAAHAMAAEAAEAGGEAGAPAEERRKPKPAATASPEDPMAATAEAAGSAAPTSATDGQATGSETGGSNADGAPSADAPGEKKKKKKKKKKKARKGEPNRPRTLFEQIHEFINEDEDKPIHINFRALLGGDGLPKFFRRNWVFILVVVFFTCIYVTCRYMMQEAVLEHNRLTEQLIDRRYKSLTLDSELLERTLSSQIEKCLKDSTVHTPTEQAYPLQTKGE